MTSVRNLLDYDFVIQALMRKTPYSQIAARETERLSIPISRNVIAGVHRDFKQGNLTATIAAKAKNADIPSLLNRSTYIYGKDREVPGGIPLFTGHLELTDDAVMVINDLHGTKMDIEFLQRTADVRKYYGINRLIIAGDLADNEAISKHRKMSLRFESNLKLEIDILTEALEWLCPQYSDGVIVLPGNHDLWLIEALEGAFSYSHAIRMLTRSDEVRQKLTVSDYDRMTLYSGDRTWTIAHQAMYNPSPLVVAQRLSEQFETDIYTTHQHISAGPIRSKNGKHILMDVGGMFDPRKWAYVNMKTAVHREMQQGFATIINGKGKLWTPDTLMTDWNIYNHEYA